MILNEIKIRPTRIKGLGYAKITATLWRFYDTETNSSTGPDYLSKAELLADIDRFAKEYGLLG